MNNAEAAALPAVCRTDAIPREIALQLCTEIRQENRRKWYTLAAMLCRECQAFSRDDPTKMCFSSRG